jgi:2-amino-4-hydroxy-6-hydroxymethyldihydropteridine diphosphokinase
MARIFISLGSNIDAEHHIRAGVAALRREFGDLALSSVFESEAVGFNGRNFLNMVAGADTELSVAQVVGIFKRIEREHGRLPGAKKFSPRTLDLDLLLYDNLVCEAPVTLPRAEITANAFVLWPLAEILPEGLHPLAHISYRELWDGFDKQSQRLWPIDFSWSC